MPISKEAGVIRAALVELMGGRCVDCGARNALEFSHERATGLDGESRGSVRRVLNVCRNVRAYRLRCKRCHTRFDGKMPKGGERCRYHPGSPLEQCGCPPTVQ